MCSYNKVNGYASCENNEVLNKELKQEVCDLAVIVLTLLTVSLLSSTSLATSFPTVRCLLPFLPSVLLL
jgi:hypothetical protein